MKLFRQFYLTLALFCGITSFASAQSQTNNHLIAAREYLKSGENIKARLELDSAAKLSPNNPIVSELLGDVYSDEEKYARAILNYDLAIAANSTSPELFMKRAKLHRILKNHRIYVLSDYNAAIRLDPENIEYYKIKANYYANNTNPDTHKYDFQAASETIAEAIAIKKSDPELNYLKSKYLSAGEYYLSALAEITKAISLDSKNPLYYAQRGKINFGLTRYEDSYADYGRAINLDQTKYYYYEQRAHCNYNMGNYVRAYDDYSKAIDMIIMEISQQRGDIDSSSPLNKSLRLNLLYRGMSLVQDNRPYDGCDDFKRAYRMGESKARNYMRRYCY